MRKEVEVKAKINDLNLMVQKLTNLGCVLSLPIVQIDSIFVDDNYGEFDKFQSGKNLLRIREADGKFIFTIKQPQNNEQDSIEYETEISEPGGMREAILLMGCHEVIQVYKTRIKTNYKDWEICLDDVRELGFFIEVEKIGENIDVDATQNELFNFLKSLGVKPEDRETSGYDTLTYRAQKALK